MNVQYPIPEGGSGGLGAQCANVATDQSTISGAYTDLATVGPAITLTTGTTATIWCSAQIYSAASGNNGYISVAVSGASAVAASDGNSGVSCSPNASALVRPAGVCIKFTGLTPGVNTFTTKYRTDGGAEYHFFNRSLVGVPT